MWSADHKWSSEHYQMVRGCVIDFVLSAFYRIKQLRFYDTVNSVGKVVLDVKMLGITEVDDWDF